MKMKKKTKSNLWSISVSNGDSDNIHNFDNEKDFNAHI